MGCQPVFCAYNVHSRKGLLKEVICILNTATVTEWNEIFSFTGHG